MLTHTHNVTQSYTRHLLVCMMIYDVSAGIHSFNRHTRIRSHTLTNTNIRTDLKKCAHSGDIFRWNPRNVFLNCVWQREQLLPTLLWCHSLSAREKSDILSTSHFRRGNLFFFRFKVRVKVSGLDFVVFTLWCVSRVVCTQRHRLSNASLSRPFLLKSVFTKTKVSGLFLTWQKWRGDVCQKT